MLNLLQQSSIHLRWQQHPHEMQTRSHQLPTCLQLVLNRKNKVDESPSISWLSHRHFQRRLQFLHSFQLHWCLELGGSQQPLWYCPPSHSRSFSQILMHLWELHHIRRVKTHFYEVLHEVINWQMSWLCWSNFFLFVNYWYTATQHCIFILVQIIFKMISVQVFVYCTVHRW